jgi:hypothetical protein
LKESEPNAEAADQPANLRSNDCDVLTTEAYLRVIVLIAENAARLMTALDDAVNNTDNDDCNTADNRPHNRTFAGTGESISAGIGADIVARAIIVTHSARCFVVTRWAFSWACKNDNKSNDKEGNHEKIAKTIQQVARATAHIHRSISGFCWHTSLFLFSQWV